MCKKITTSYSKIQAYMVYRKYQILKKDMLMKRFLTFALALLLTLTLCVSISAETETTDVTILFTHDLHSHLLPTAKEDAVHTAAMHT